LAFIKNVSLTEIFVYNLVFLKQ